MKNKKTIQMTIIIFGIVAVLFIIYYLWKSSSVFETARRNDENLKKSTQVIEQRTKMLEDHNDCLIRMLDDIEVYKNEHSGVSQDTITKMIEDRESECDELYPEP